MARGQGEARVSPLVWIGLVTLLTLLATAIIVGRLFKVIPGIF